MNVVCRQIQVFATGRSLIQGAVSSFCVSLSVIRRSNNCQHLQSVGSRIQTKEEIKVVIMVYSALNISECCHQSAHRARNVIFLFYYIFYYQSERIHSLSQSDDYTQHAASPRIAMTRYGVHPTMSPLVPCKSRGQHLCSLLVLQVAVVDWDGLPFCCDVY